MLRHPKVTAVSCERCVAVLHDADWEPVTRGGMEMARPSSIPPNCRGCPKIPDTLKLNKDKLPGPKNAVVLSDKNYQAYLYYLEVKSGAPMHNDPMTRRICSCIRMVEDQIEAERDSRKDITPLVMALFGGRQ